LNKTIDITDQLGDELYHLALMLKDDCVPLIIGGGYGLLLKQLFIEESKQKTLRTFPLARSTNDLDIFLAMEFITDAGSMNALKNALRERGFSSVDSARHYQFEREIEMRGLKRRIKVDLLAPLPRDSDIIQTMKIDSRRIRPKVVNNIHAHTAPEAFSVGLHTTTVNVGRQKAVEVHLPHPFSFLLLKLFAYRDQRLNKDKDFGRYHAFDLFRILAMMTEKELSETRDLISDFSNDPIVVEARKISDELFEDQESKGILAIREYAKEVQYDVSEDTARAVSEDFASLFATPL